MTRSFGRLVGLSVDRSVGRFVGASVHRSVGVGPSVRLSVRPSCKTIYESFCNRARALATWVLLVLVFGNHFR